MTTQRKIPGLKADYGSLDLRIEDRNSFIEDAQRLLQGISDELKAENLIGHYFVRHLPSNVLGYAGEVAGHFFDHERRFAVSLVLSHLPDEVKTRPDGISGYALFRRTRPIANRDLPGLDPNVKAEDRRPLYGTYPDALLHQIKNMLATHELNPAAPKKEKAAG